MTTVELRQATVAFGTGSRRLLAVNSVDLTVQGGAVMGLVGESASGKSTVAKAVTGLVSLTSGQILLDGEPIGELRRRSRAQRRRVQMVFQDPYASLNPRMPIGESVAEALPARRRSRGMARDEVAALLELVGLDADRAPMPPSSLSGGQRQRVALARALAAKPEVLVADEITSSLDVSVQGAILNLLRELQQSMGFGMLFISHNLAVVRYVSDSVAVMYQGRVVEQGECEALLASPAHPYTQALLAAVPSTYAARFAPELVVDGEAQDPHHQPTGCAFHPRCPQGPRVLPDRAACVEADPHVDAAARLHQAACHFAPVRAVNGNVLTETAVPHPREPRAQPVAQNPS